MTNRSNNNEGSLMRTFALTVLLLLANQLAAADPFPKFKAVTIDPNIGKVCYAVTVADVLGKGKKQLVISPLNKTTGKGVRLTAFEIPKDPTKDRWPSTVLDATLNRMHNHWHTQPNPKVPAVTFTASQEGVHIIAKNRQGKWSKFKVPKSQGAGEIKVGRLKGGKFFIATVEPMHGTALVVYNRQADDQTQRTVIDKGFRRGHALWVADFDGDGEDEIAFGHSDTPKTHGVNVYDAQSVTKWTKHVLDSGGIATEDLTVADFNGDGRPDIIAGGRKTHNVKLYVNMKK